MNIKYLAFIGLVASLYCMSCSPKLNPVGSSSLSEKVLYPRNADTAYFQYLRAYTTSEDIEEVSNFQKSIIGKSPLRNMGKPYGVASSKGKILVADISVQGVNILDLDNKSFKQFKPIHKDISFVLTTVADDNGDLFIVDSHSSTVVIYDSNYKYKDEFKIAECKRPSRIKLKGNKIYISDLTTKNIYMYDKSTYKLIGQFIKEDVKAGDDAFIYIPMDFDLTDEYIYVIDAGAYQVKIYTHDGELVKSFGGQGASYGLFNRPKSIAVDKDGNILVVDSSFNNIQIFNNEGEVLLAFGNAMEIEQGKFTPGLILPTSMVVDYNNLDHFKKYVDAKYNLKYLVYVVNQRGAGRLKVFGRIELK
jgi:WD40 repeat protein